jgi:hypothetical protein
MLLLLHTLLLYLSTQVRYLHALCRTFAQFPASYFQKFFFTKNVPLRHGISHTLDLAPKVPN